VYLGTWNFELVALKELKDLRFKKEYFEQEVIALHKANSQHIVRMLGICVPPDPYAIVLEFMGGGSLNEYIKTPQYQEQNITVRMSYVLDIAIGMHQLHRLGFVHRDLNLRNVLLIDDKKHCKISDFGLAKEKDATFASESKGTFMYLAPESWPPLALFSPKSDVYSFGICMHELWAGNAYIIKEKAADLIREVNPSRPVFSPNCDSEYAKLASECWSYHREERPSFENIVPRLLAIKERISNLMYGK